MKNKSEKNHNQILGTEASGRYEKNESKTPYRQSGRKNAFVRVIYKEPLSSGGGRGSKQKPKPNTQKLKRG